ncbi:1,4-alpha-glucan branching protein GlgB [Psychrosphaera aestuarii]|uniref:1,4-alpha-glucan branching protein GlgB n=1 Tax=Psychrosphaera aestuarii TaxID=1266052 RepID=UPI003CC7E994
MNSENKPNSSSALANSLNRAVLIHPFNELGLFKNEQQPGYFIRAWFPGAVKVELLEAKRNRQLATFDIADDLGLFICELPKRRKAFRYRLRVTKSHAGGLQQTIVDDPYQYKQEAYYAVHHVRERASNIYNQLGAQLITLDSNMPATRFAVYAPHAQSCSVIGDFNHWDGRALPMEKTNCGHFVLVVPGVTAGSKYKFELKDQHLQRLPHKADPIGFYHDQYPSFASVVYDHNQYQWQDTEWQNRPELNHYQEPMSIYEVHLGSWKNKTDIENNNQVLSYHELIDELIPYVVEMGFTHIEVLPISEHPFTGSWGYQPTGMFAATSRFGDPDGFKAFVDACHQAKIGVIVDWVPAHFPEDAHGLANFDGTHLYDYEDPKKGWHPDWQSCIYDFGKDEVRQFLVASAVYWCDKFHVDGIRVDAVASMLYLDYSRNEGEWLPNVDGGNHNYEAISLLKWMNHEVKSCFPKSITIAEESTSYQGVSHSIEEGGLGFDYKWNMGWMHDSLVFMNKDPMYRRYHHRDITFSTVYQYDENFVLPLSHDEVVHGKGSLIRKMPGDEWQQAANQRVYAGYMFAHPGKKLNFMGNEFAQFEEWNHNTELSWNALENDKNQGIQTLYRDLNNLYKTNKALHQLDYDTNGFEWLDHQDEEKSILAFIRRDAEGNEIIVICNFTPIPRDDYRVGVNTTGTYQVLLNTDSKYYWGSNYNVGYQLDTNSIPWQGKQNSMVINLPPLSALYLTKTNIS